MSLDLFTRNADDAVNYAARVSAPELPSTFSDNFTDAWNHGYLTQQSISGGIRQIRARSQMVEDAVTKTGDVSFRALEGQEGGGFDVEAFNAKVAKHNADRPDLNLPQMTDEAIQQRADEIGTAQLAQSRAFAQRERTTGGAIGHFIGGMAAGFTDPVNLVAMPLAAPRALGIVKTAVAWSAIGAGSQAVIEGLNASSMERIQPGYVNSSEPLLNIAGAGAAAGVLGGGLKGLANLWTRYRTGSWPRTIRDAGNVVESEAQIASTNPMPGVEGEAAHRTAVTKAIDDLANGRPVDVEGIVTPEQAKFIEAYHGSPHDFQNFDISKIGTGEGAQAYGHGLYFAENETVARNYKRTTSDRAFVNKVAELYDEGFSPDEAWATIKDNWMDFSPGEQRLMSALEKDDWLGFDYPHQAVNAALRSLKSYDVSPETVEAARAIGNMYRVKVTAAPDRFIDWDKPMSEQSDFVRRVMQEIGIDEIGMSKPLTGADAYRRVGVKVGPQEMSDTLGREAAASKALSDAGIAGIRYLDQASRKAGDGTSNFVVFNDKNVEITHKNGQPVKPEVRQEIIDGAAGLPPKQAEMPLEPPTPPVKDLNTPTTNALKDELTPAKIEEARVNPDLADTVSRNLDKLTLERPDLEVPMGTVVDAEGKLVPTTRKVADVVEEADSRLAAAKEIEACVGPYPAEAAA